MTDNIELRRLTNELDHTIEQINREIIHEATGGVSKQAFLDVAETVSRIRARYLKAVTKLARFSKSGDIDADTVKRLSSLRRAYEESLDGYNALYHALQREYMELNEHDEEE